jgi:hypothetical protein
MANLQGDSDNHDNANVLHAHFGGLEQVVTDDAMSKLQKLDALDVLEQDARQLATASNEGMAGGEPTQLREVLEARQALESPPILSHPLIFDSEARHRNFGWVNDDSSTASAHAKAA